MAENEKRVTQDEAIAASKLLKRYEEQEREARMAKAEADRARNDALIGDLGGRDDLREWARQKVEREKARGIGIGASDDGIEWTLMMLRRSMVDVCDAFGVTPADLGART